MRTTTIVLVTLLGVGASGLAASTGAGQRGAHSVTTAALYLKQCASCHGPKGEGTPGVRPLNGPLAHGDRVEDIEKVIRDGIKGTTMAGYRGTLTDAQVRAVAEFVHDMSR